MRFPEQSETIREALHGGSTDFWVLITDLGGTTTLMVVAALLFWLTKRHESALIISYAVAGVAFIIGLKALIGLPRPPSELHLIPYENDAYGFPSGHAFASVLVYGGIVATFNFARERLAILVASLLVLLVSISRVVLGVHYLGDVLAGIVVGVGFLIAMERLVAGDPRRGFAIGLILAIPALIITGVGDDALLALGGAIGGLVAMTRLESLPPLRSKIEGAVLTIVGCGAIVAMMSVEPLVATFTPALVVLYAALFITIFLIPAFIGRLDAPSGITLNRS